MGRLITGICDFVSLCLCVHTLRGKRLELSAPNLVCIWCMTITQHVLIPRSKGQGHAVIKFAVDVGMHVDRTAWIF